MNCSLVLLRLYLKKVLRLYLKKVALWSVLIGTTSVTMSARALQAQLGMEEQAWWRSNRYGGATAMEEICAYYDKRGWTRNTAYQLLMGDHTLPLAQARAGGTVQVAHTKWGQRNMPLRTGAGRCAQRGILARLRGFRAAAHVQRSQ